MSEQAPSIQWSGASGKLYTYFIVQRHPNFDPKQAGNYIYAKLNPQNQWVPVYIGETGDLQDRYDNHEKKECVDAEGATHIHVHLSSRDKAVRVEEESDLIKKWQPPCNIQGTARSLLDAAFPVPTYPAPRGTPPI